MAETDVRPLFVLFALAVRSKTSSASCQVTSRTGKTRLRTPTRSRTTNSSRSHSRSKSRSRQSTPTCMTFRRQSPLSSKIATNSEVLCCFDSHFLHPIRRDVQKSATRSCRAARRSSTQRALTCRMSLYVTRSHTSLSLVLVDSSRHCSRSARKAKLSAMRAT